MATERNVVDFKIHNLTEEQFQELKAQGKIDPNAVYCTPDESLKRNQITNCITEIPQDIKLELADGALTLKAGSIVYVPNGAGVFNKKTAKTDVKTQNLSSYPNGQYLVFDNSDLAGTSLRCNLISACYSGATAPATGAVWYDTTNNKIKIASGSTWSGNRTLPLGVITISNGAVSSIDQVFNGFGYIGSSLFKTIDNEVVTADGRNEDGTLKNKIVRTSSVEVLTMPSYMAGRNNCPLFINDVGGMSATTVNNNSYFEVDKFSDFDTSINYSAWFVREDNRWYVTTTGGAYIKKYWGRVGSFVIDSDLKITHLDIKLPFRAVDYNDFESTVEEINSSISAVDSSAVHKTGDETISGSKTFESTIHTQKTGLSVYNNSVTKGTNPTAAQYWAGILWNDKTDAATSWQNSRLGYLEMSLNTAGESKLAMGAYKNEANSSANSTIAVGYSATSGAWASAPTPSANSNGTNIATTAWVRDLFEALYPVGSLYISTGNSCPLTSIVKKSDGSNSTWTLVAAGKSLWTGNGTTGDGTVRNTHITGANNTISAGLPNIKGEFVAANSNAPAGSGAFTVKSTGDGKGWDGTAAMRSTYSFDATRSSSIYGNSTTVQPPAYVVNVWRRTA
jgi:hypothetical protein